ncbi:MAG: hypothetical protein BAA00_03545 [Parageobacillus thermoglucosidasius]|nr:MAG: hypothetical protein BAA00_03545 [Parageobacillus thermoglucosidasius]
MRDFTKPAGLLKTAKLQDAYQFAQGINRKIGFQKETFQQRFYFFDTGSLPITYGVSGSDRESIYRNNDAKSGFIS